MQVGSFGSEGATRYDGPKLPLVARLLDCVLVGAVLFGSAALNHIPWRTDYGLLAIAAMLLFSLSAQIWGLYRPPHAAHPLDASGRLIVLSWLTAVLSLLLIWFGSEVATRFSAAVLIVWVVATPLAFAAWRMASKLALRRREVAPRRVAIVGAERGGQALARHFQELPGSGLQLVGLFDDRELADGGRGPQVGDEPDGDFAALRGIAQQGAVDQVYIALPLRSEARIRDVAEKLADLPVSVHLATDFFTYGLLPGRFQYLGDVCTLNIFDTPLNGSAAYLKRLVDIVLSSLILCLAALPMAMIALGVRASSPGRVIFKQHRCGLDGRQVVVWKFRTMTVTEDGEHIVQAREDDPRVTPFGAFLRRTFLDELPQFINVLQGHMSIVGPRPHALAHNEKYRRLIPFYMLRHRVKPGITGWAQAKGFRGETEQLSKMKARVDHDLWYIRNWTLRLDLKIILLTALQVLRGLLPRGRRGAVSEGGAVAPGVLLLVENLPVPLDRRVWLEARSLRARGYRVSVVCPKMYDCTAGYERLDGIDIFRFPLLFEASHPLGYLLEYGSALALMLGHALRAWLKSGFDVIHVANPPDLLVLIALPFKLIGKRVIYDQHDLCPELFQAKGKGGPILHRVLLGLERISYSLADAVIVPNQSYRQIALERGKKAKSSVFVVRNGPLSDALAPTPSSVLQPLIGYVGVMGDQDSIDVLLEVAEKLKHRYPEWRYVLLGDGSHRAGFERYAKDLGVSDRVRFAGMVDESRIAAELASCSLCLVPDRVNAFTARSTMNKVMEYMALAKPIVQFDTPEGRYSARGASLYARPNDVDDFAARVAELLDDPKRAREMGEAGRTRFLASLHWGHSVDALYRAYDYVLSPERSRRLVRLPGYGETTKVSGSGEPSETPALLEAAEPGAEPSRAAACRETEAAALRP